jgi:fibrillarin-like rRNA methylase
MNAYPKQGGQILNTESSTHTIVVKDSLCESSSNEEDFDDLDEDHNTIAEAPQFASGRKETSSISESVNGLVP